MRILAVLLAFGCAAAAPRMKTGARLANAPDRSCSPERAPVENLLVPNAPWTAGVSSLADPVILRIAAVQINERYYDHAQLDGRRMFDAVLDAWVGASRGALRRQGNEVFVGRASRVLDPVEEIWQIPPRVQTASNLLLRELPEENPLKRGFVAELLAVQAILSTLSPRDRLVLPDVLGKDAPQAERPKPEGLPAGIVYFRPGPFAPPVVEALRQAVAKAAGVVLDLRGHPGGPLDATADVADLFLASGPIFTANERDASREQLALDDGLASERAKVAVLVDGQTSAGAEVVAQALRLAGRAVIVGQPTAGAGLIQLLFSYLPSGHFETRVGLRLTVAEAFLGGKSFEGVGLAPDVQLEPARAPRPGCAPLGEPAARTEGDPVAVAARILQSATTASRADLLSAAQSVR